MKGAHALVDCAGGLLLWAVSTETIVGWVNSLTQDELVENPNDFLASHLLALAR